MHIINKEKDKVGKMIIIKYAILISLFASSSYIGFLLANRYQGRVRELKEMKISLTILSTKIKLTYEPIPQIFEELGNKEKSNISQIFQIASRKMKELSAGQAWIEAITTENTNLKKEDIEVLKGLSNLLGKVDLEGQIREIELVDNFLNKQIEKAEEECKKSEKLYKALGITVGLAMVIILI